MVINIIWKNTFKYSNPIVSSRILTFDNTKAKSILDPLPMSIWRIGQGVYIMGRIPHNVPKEKTNNVDCGNVALSGFTTIALIQRRKSTNAFHGMRKPGIQPDLDTLILQKPFQQF